MGPDDRFCAGCGIATDATIVPLGESASPEPRVNQDAAPHARRRRAFGAVAGVVALAVVALSFGPWQSADDPALDPAAEAEVLGEQLRRSIAIAEGAEDSTTAMQWFPDRRDDQWIAMLVGTDLIAVDVTSGNQRRLTLPQPSTFDRVTMVDGHLVMIGTDRAWAMNLADGALIDMGAALQLRPSPNDGHVWLGQGQEAQGTAQLDVETVWEERSLDNEVLRQTVRTFPLEFDRPDLIWGFDSSVFRLTTSETAPWRLVADGYPVAASATDLILNRCVHGDDSDRKCTRVWFALPDGTQKDRIFSDLAANIPTHYGVRISPSGRFAFRQLRPGEPVSVWRMASGKAVAVDCNELETVQWARDDAYLACQSPDGLQLVETANGQSLLLEDVDAAAWTFVDGADLGA